MSVTTKPVSSYLEDDESEEYRLVDQSGGVTRTSQGSTTNLGSGDGGSVLCVTNGRVLFVVGDEDGDGSDDVVSLPYSDIDEVTVKDGFLRTSFSVSTAAGETFSISPDDGALEPAAEYIREVVFYWQRTVDLFEEAESLSNQSAPESESGQAPVVGPETESAFEEAADSFAKVRLRPIESVESLRQQFEDRWLDRYVTHAEACRERAEKARDAGDFGVAVTELERSLDAWAQAETVASEHGFGDVDTIRDRIGEVEQLLDTVRKAPATQARESIQTATTASDPEDEITAWRTARRTYVTVLQSDWATLTIDVEDEDAALHLQLDWIEASLVDRLHDRAAELTIAGEKDHEAGDSEAARGQYEQALDHLVELREITNGDGTSAGLGEKISALEHEIEMTKWEWGDQ